MTLEELKLIEDLLVHPDWYKGLSKHTDGLMLIRREIKLKETDFVTGRKINETNSNSR